MKKWISGLLLVGLCAAGHAQIDWSTFRGVNTRTGVNANPIGPNPQNPTLRWYFPLQSTQGIFQNSTGRPDIIVDNVDPGYADIPGDAWRTPLPNEESPDFFASTPGSLSNPYRVANVVASTSGTGDPTSGQTASATWTIAGQTDKLYLVQVWFPSSGTFNGTMLTPNSEFAVYKIQYGDTGGTFREFVDIVPHVGGGSWVRLGNKLGQDKRVFRAGDSGQIRVTLYNTVPRDENDVLMGPVPGRIVAADAVRAVPSPGQIFGSPVVAQLDPLAAEVAAYVPRLESAVDPTDPTGSLEISAAKLYALDAKGPNIGNERWSWSPNFLTNVSLIFDNNGPNFNADAAWTTSTTSPGFFGSDYMSAPVAPMGSGGRAAWTPNLVNDGFYDVYAWFPRSGNGELHARGAHYVITENGVQVDAFVNQDTQGGNWVRIGGRSFENNVLQGGLSVEVFGESDNLGDTGRVVCADAIAFVKDYSAALFSTPAVATINLRLSGGTLAPTLCTFVAAEDGRIYCLDARGNGAGSTTVYWAYPSLPDTNDPNWVDPNDPIDGPPGNRIPWPSSFGVSSPVVQNVGGKDLVFIAAQNGRIYAIDATGRGDYAPNRPGTAAREWTWPRATYNQSTNTLNVDPARLPFVASVAFDPTGSQILAGGTEGRLFALDAGGNGDRTTDENWMYPLLTDPVIGAISSTPTVGGAKVVFPSFDGRVYARDLTGGNTGNWEFPAVGQTALQPFEFTSAAYVPAAELGTPTDLVYFVNDNGRIYAVQGTDGVVSWEANEAPGGASSSPSFGHITPPGTTLANTPVITFGSKRGEFLGFYARPGTGPGNQNIAGGKLAWGYMSAGTSVFASPAVSYTTDGIRGYLFHAGEDGFLYAFSEGGLLTVDPGFINPPGGQIGTPDDPGSGDYINLKLKLISKANHDSLRQTPPVGDPAAMPDIYAGAPVLEFGERIYLLAYDFPLNAPVPLIRFRLTGPGGLSLQYDRPAQPDPTDPNKGFAVIGIPLNYTGPNFITPGDLLQVDVQVVEGGRIIDPPILPRDMTVANPLAVTTMPSYRGVPAANKSIGWSPDPSFQFGGLFENRINGSNDKAILSTIGQITHGSSGNIDFWVADRSRVVDMTSTGLTAVRAARTDAYWQGGTGAVVKPLPYIPAWEQMPFSQPNLSLDYPDIDRSQLSYVSDPNGNAANPIISATRLEAPSNYDPNTPLTRILEGVRYAFEMQSPRFQPANLTLFADTSGARLDAGYRAKTIIYVDSNGNGRPDGQELTLTDLPPGARREPYRSLNTGGSVTVDEKMHIDEPTVDLGSLPHSLGYTPMQPWLNNGFVPDISTGAPFRDFFKSFTLVNEGNVNMLDLRVAKRVGQEPGPNYYSVAFTSDANDPLSWLDGVPNIISNLNPPYAPNNGALDPNGNPRVTLHKARPGDRAGTLLTVPDFPYGITPPANTLPLIGVGVPLGFPVGDYSQLINVVEDTRNFDQALSLSSNGTALEAYTEPTMRVKFLNRESRLTGGRTSGTAVHVDENLPAQSNFAYTNTQPSGFRDPGGNLHMVWSANRPGPANIAAGPQARDNWTLFFSRLGGSLQTGAPGPAGSSPLRDLMGWTAFSNSRFWTTPNGPRPAEGPNALFAGTPGAIVGNPQHTWPSFPVNARAAGSINAMEHVFWNGKALKDDNGDGVPDYEDNRIFYARYNVGTSNVEATQWMNYDPQLEKKRIRALNFGDPNALAVFWYGETGGASKMFHNVRMANSSSPGDQTANWSNNRLIDPGLGFASAKDPQPILRVGGIDIVFTGQLKDRPQPEIFYAKFSANRFGQLGRILDMPERNREALVRDGSSNTYRARGVSWDIRDPLEVWIRRPNQAPVAILVANTRLVDENTEIVTYDSELGGKVYLDPHVGTVRMTTAVGSDVQVELRYTPRVIRVSELGNAGGHSNPTSFFDERPQWDRQFYFNANGSAIGSGDTPLATRLWHIYERGATGPGQTKRPYMKTQRLAILLNHPVGLQSGNLAAPVTVTGMLGRYYQVDPGNGRVYFESEDENRQVTVAYSWRNALGGLQRDTVTGYVTWQTESAEKPVPIEQAIDEGTVFAFADPFVWRNNDPRAGLVWMFYTSTRSGTRDVYYQTLSPRLSPIRTP